MASRKDKDRRAEPALNAHERTPLLGDDRDHHAVDSPVPIIVSDADAPDGEGWEDYDLLRASTSIPSGLAPEALDEHLLRGRSRSRSRSRSTLLCRAKTNGHTVHSSAPRSISSRGVKSGDETDVEEGLPLLVDENAVTDDDEDEDDDDDDETQTYLVDTDKRRFWIVYLGIMLTYFIACFDGTIMASSHPVITSYFRSSNRASWLSTAFLLTSTAFQPLVGRLSDALGRKPVYLATMTVFALATLWCALAQSMTSFILARAVCGIGAGGSMTLGAITISDLVPVDRRGNYQAMNNIVYGLAAASGAAFGGLMADTLGWRWEFGVQVFPIVGSLTVGALVIPRDLGIQGKHTSMLQALKEFDFCGSALLTTSTTFLILGLNLGGNVLPWSHPLTITSLCIFAVAFPACLWVESRVEKPIMPLVLLHSSPRANIIFSNVIASFLLNAILFNVPIFFQAVLLTSATKSGLYLVVPTATASAVGAMTGFLISLTKRLKWPLALGTWAYLLGAVALSCMSRGWPTWLYLACLVPAAAGQGFQFPGTFMAVLSASEQRDQAVVTSTLVLWRALGNVLGIAASSLVLQNALLAYLRAYVTVPPGEGEGEDGAAWKARLVDRVRASVGAVAKLPPGDTRDQVILSYQSAVRVVFLACIGLALVSVLLIAPIHLPPLSAKKGDDRKRVDEDRESSCPEADS